MDGEETDRKGYPLPKWIQLVKKGVPILMGTPFSFRENLIGKRSFSSPGGEQIALLMELSAKMSVP
ncbi:hypothetical protein ACWNXI_10005 [Caldibacillus thermoamylovorans]